MAFFQKIISRVIIFVMLLSLLILNLACQKNEPPFQSDESNLLISSEVYDEEFLGSLTILEAKVRNQILYLKVGYSGCDGNKDFTLVFSEQIFYTAPPSLEAKLIFEPITLCAAFFTNDIQADLTSLNHMISKPYRIRLDGWSGVIEVR